jgi:hypothetical protein
MPEAKIKIGRYPLNPAQSFAFRVMLEEYLDQLKKIEETETEKAFKRRIVEVHEMLHLTLAEKKYAKP